MIPAAAGASVVSPIASGRLLGIARRARPRAPMETMTHAAVGLATGVEGDARGVVRPGGRGRRQVTAMLVQDWHAALADLGDPAIDWWDRRANLLLGGIDLPRVAGALLGVGGAVFEITGECDPCVRMEAVAPGLCAALTPGWRGGRTMRVIVPGRIALGDPVTLRRIALGDPVALRPARDDRNDVMREAV